MSALGVRRQANWWCAVALVASAGCGGANMAPVSGTVQHDGKPLPTGRVFFRPIGEGAIAQGTIQSDGTFRLTTNKADDGAVVGKYRVMIVGDKEAADKKLRVSYMGPKEPGLEVVAGRENTFVIDVRAKDGWQANKDDD